MKVVDGIESLGRALTRSVLTIGNFDGVHRAHQSILRTARPLADETEAPLTVLTFEPHPLTIVAPDRAPQRLTPHAERLRLLEQAGVDVTVVARSEPGLLSLPAEEFVETVIAAVFRPVHIVEGPSFGFGRGRKGTPDLLRTLAARFGFHVHIVEPVTVRLADGRAVMVSSSLIRQMVRDGDVEGAADCLGRPYTLHGVVGRGDGRGRHLGFPTANLESVEQLMPADGVYAGRARCPAGEFLAAVSIGVNPTFGGDSRRIEAYLLDFDGDLYGHTITLALHRRLRGPRSFPSPEQLAQQVQRDVEAVRAGPAARSISATEAPLT